MDVSHLLEVKMAKNDTVSIDALKQKQLLRVVTSSFYKELIKQGVNKSGILTVSMDLLDYVTKGNHNGHASPENLYDFDTSQIDNQWQANKCLRLGAVKICPLKKEHIPTVADWLREKEINNTFIRFFPKEKAALSAYLLNESRDYLAVMYQDTFVGIIGADGFERQSRKLEMKKFIGTNQFRNKGIGKLATFLFLFYAFHIIEMNKVFIHSLDTNINNINLNSRFGFELEGLLYHDILIEDEYHDVLRMSLLKSKWNHNFNHGAEGNHSLSA
ncbi:MAG TPA: N-acetyltransferase [Caldithrix abyssi]|uniref:N-acetyltransferase n=1 Tax=Caldithrix abyssi TaxID=187145 RepID=A0A7V5VEX2_CALAY|nr:N-acetyltransferase [Caldithrix abyssi]